MGVGPLANFSNVSKRFNNAIISSFIQNGQWNVDLIIIETPPQFVLTILDITLQHQQDLHDKLVWKLNSDDNFTISLAWNIIRDHRNHTKLNNYTWHKHIPFKCSFCFGEH